jgi:hypothetical protein
MTIICFLFVAASVARGERSFSGREWLFAVAGGAVFILYLFTRGANVAAALTTIVDALGYGPTFVRGWAHPRKDSVTSFALNGAKFSSPRFWLWTRFRLPRHSIPSRCSS